MKFLTRIFKRKKLKTSNPYAIMGSVGISPSHMITYSNAVNSIKKYEEDK
jgi:hypothetical protein